jgi:hypothetical protein
MSDKDKMVKSKVKGQKSKLRTENQTPNTKDQEPKTKTKNQNDSLGGYAMKKQEVHKVVREGYAEIAKQSGSC